MTSKRLAATLLVALLTATTQALAEEAEDMYSDGHDLHQENCQKCHTDAMYTRDNRKVKTLAALGKQVRRCRDNLGMAWFDTDTDAVIHFLNTKYYKF